MMQDAFFYLNRHHRILGKTGFNLKTSRNKIFSKKVEEKIVLSCHCQYNFAIKNFHEIYAQPLQSKTCLKDVKFPEHHLRDFTTDRFI